MLKTSLIRNQLKNDLSGLSGLVGDVSPDRLTDAEAEDLTPGLKALFMEFNGADIDPISIGPTRGFEVVEAWDVVFLFRYQTGDTSGLINGVEDVADSNVSSIIEDLLDDRTLSGFVDNIEPTRVEYSVSADGEYMTVRATISLNIIYRTTKTD